MRLDTVDAGVTQIGPFEILGRIGVTSGGDLLLGRDARLKRFVWINRRPNAHGEMPLARRQLSQATRLRWLAGGDNWDAFEALDGSPADVSASDWQEMRQWLGDLSRDLEGAETVNALPALAADRVWRLPTGRVVLLDFRAPGSSEPEHIAPSVPQFLADLAARANCGVREPHAAALVTHALAEEWMTTRAAAAILQKFTHAPVSVNRWQRALPILACALPAIVFAGGKWAQEATTAARFERPDAALHLVLDHMTPTPDLPGSQDSRNHYRAFVAQSFGGAIAADPHFWSSARGQEFLRDRAAIEHSIRWFSDHDPREALAGRAAANAWLETERRRAGEWPYGTDRVRAFAMSLLSVLVPIGIAAFIASFVASPLWFRPTGQALEDADGLDAPLVRRVARAAVTWSPLLLGLGRWNPILVVVLLAAGAIYAIASPERAIQDRVAGTFVAPR